MRYKFHKKHPWLLPRVSFILARPEGSLGVFPHICVAFVTARLRYHLACLLIVEPSGRVQILGRAT